MDKTKNSSKHKINLTNLYENDKEFNLECIMVDKLMEKIKKYKNHVLDSSDKLCEVLKLDSEIGFYLEKLYVYAHINNDLNLSDAKWNKNFAKVSSLYSKYSLLSSFLVPELLEKDFKFVKTYIAENEYLKNYEYTLKLIYRSKKHILSANDESIVSKFNKINKSTIDSITKLLNVECTYEEVLNDDNVLEKVHSGNLECFLFSKNREVRKNAFNSFYKSLGSINLTISSLINGVVEYNNAVSGLKKYPNYLDMSLDVNDVDVKIYDNLIKNVSKKLPLFDKYWDFKRSILKLSKLKLYDLNVRVNNSLDKKYTFDEARDIALSALLIFGKDYSDMVNKIFSESWIDASLSENKKMISYTTAAYATNPYIFLNYNGTYKDISTLVHEIGHAMHFHYSKESNEFCNYDNNIFVAEVASQVNEILLSKYMLNKCKSKEEKLSLLEDKLNDFEFTMRKATMSAEFEKMIFDYNKKEGTLSSEILSNMQLKLAHKYYGENIEIDDAFKYDWIRLSQMFGKFYVYQYATGYVAALEIAESIWNKVDGAFENYIKFLSLGSKMDPVSSLKVAGIDMNGSKIYTNAFKYFEKTLDEYKKIYSSKEDTINE